ncbi:barstar family protein [Mycobacteroides chelonae]
MNENPIHSEGSIDTWLRDPSLSSLALTLCKPPGLHSLLDRERGWAIRGLDGRYMANLSSMFHEFSSAFQFEYESAMNWDGLHDWMTDLSWFRQRPHGYLIVVYNADQLLAEEVGELSIFAKIIVSWSKYWNARDIAFKCLLQIDGVCPPGLSIYLENIHPVTIVI